MDGCDKMGENCGKEGITMEIGIRPYSADLKLLQSLAANSQEPIAKVLRHIIERYIETGGVDWETQDLYRKLRNHYGPTSR